MSIDDSDAPHDTPDWLQSQQTKADESAAPKSRRPRRTKAQMLQDQPVPYQLPVGVITASDDAKALRSSMYPELSWYSRNYWAMQWGPVVISLLALAVSVTAILR